MLPAFFMEVRFKWGLTERAIQIAMSESMVYNRNDRRDKAKEAIDWAVDIARHHPRKGSSKAEIDLEKALILRGDAETGRDILLPLIQNNHEDTEIKQVLRDINSVLDTRPIHHQNDMLIFERIDNIA
ncbi:MAG: hypothetical protein WC405_02295 [Syntrophales bacterium]